MCRPPQVVPFPGDTLWIVNSGHDPLKSRCMDQKEDYVARGIKLLGLISFHLAAFRTGLKLNAQTSDQSLKLCVGHFESSLTIWTAMVLLQ